MLKVLPVKKENFDNIYPLLTQIPSPIPIPKETWRNLFNQQWDCQVEPFGYVLMDENEIVGFLGLINVHREINGQKHHISCLTSWTVKKQYTGHSIKLLFPFIRDHERTLTCFTPAKNVDAVFRKFGFQELHAFWQVIPFWRMSLHKNDYQIHFDIDHYRSVLTEEDWHIYCAHQKFSSAHFIIKNGETYCYGVAKRVLKKNLPFLHIHYLSDKKPFMKVIQKFAGMICWRFKVLGLIIFSSYLLDKKIKGAITLPIPAKPLFRSQTLKSQDIDSLYSEYFVLDF